MPKYACDEYLVIAPFGLEWACYLFTVRPRGLGHIGHDHLWPQPSSILIQKLEIGIMRVWEDKHDSPFYAYHATLLLECITIYTVSSTLLLNRVFRYIFVYTRFLYIFLKSNSPYN